MAETESGFNIDGEIYPVPSLESFDMDEAQVLYDYCGITLEDFAPAHPNATEEEQEEHEASVAAKVKNPGFWRAMMHIAYARGNPDMSPARVKALIGKAKLLETLETLATEEEDADPQTGFPSEPSRLSDSEQPSPRSDSGSPSPNGSDRPDETPEATGIIESDTSSPGLVRTT